MPVLLKKVAIRSPLPKEELLQKIADQLYQPPETGLFKVSRFIRNNWAAQLYYGSRRENAFTMFCHLPMKRDGGGVRFNGVVVPTQEGCTVAGYIRQGLAAYVFALVWAVVMFMATVVFIVDAPEYALLTVFLLVAGLLMTFSGKKNAAAIEGFLKTLAEANA